MARKNNVSDIGEQINASVEEPKERSSRPMDASGFLPTGSTLFNLMLSDRADGGYALGTMANIIGDSSSGKTFLALTAFAEAAMLKRFKDYRFIYDDAEAACAFDIPYLFGDKVADRIEPPNQDTTKPASDTVQAFCDNVHDALDDGRPFIYVLDSLDSIGSEEEINKYEEQRMARAKGKDIKGSYGMTKAKGMSELFRLIIRKISKTNSLLIIISQTRDNIDPMSFSKKTRAGGRALKFYATHEVWAAIGKTHKKRERVVGVDAILKTTKNKITGKRRDTTLPIFYDYGIDDIGSCIDFLQSEGYWTKTGQKINATHFDLSCTREKLIRTIEEGHLEKELRKITGEAWNEIESSLRLDRKPKY